MNSSPRVLVVDDEAHVRKYLRMVLKDAFGAAEVLEAAGREEAMAHFARALPELVLLDLNLVGESGLDVLREMRALDGGVPVVILTSVNVRHTVEEALNAGATNYILKDTPPEEMKALLLEVMPGPGNSSAGRM